jgi:ferredoxin
LRENDADGSCPPSSSRGGREGAVSKDEQILFVGYSREPSQHLPFSAANSLAQSFYASSGASVAFRGLRAGPIDPRRNQGKAMPNVTFSSPILHKNLTVYAIAGDTSTILSVAEAHKAPIPHDCKDGECGSCLIEVVTLSGKTMGSLLTEKEKSLLKSLGKITGEEIRAAEVEDIAPRYRLACQYVVRDQDILVKFTGEPGGA